MEKSSINQAVQFFLRFILIASLILIVDQGVGGVIKHFYFRQGYGEGAQLTWVIDSLDSDVLIFGSSRANHQYVPEIFESRLPYTCFNAGKDGNYLLYSYAIFKVIVKRYNPKLIIFDTRPYEIGNIPSEYDRLSILLPYYQKYPEIRQVIDSRGPFEKIKHLSAIYSYNSLIFQIARGNIGSDKIKISESKGYVPLHKTMKSAKIDSWDLSNFKADKNKINALRDIISTCKQKKIELIFVYSPIWKVSQDSAYNNLISDICSELGTRYIDMSNDTTFLNRPDYFEDLSHLNDNGARVFTNMLIDRLPRTY